jgi:hypothetical protein
LVCTLFSSTTKLCFRYIYNVLYKCFWLCFSLLPSIRISLFLRILKIIPISILTWFCLSLLCFSNALFDTADLNNLFSPTTWILWSWCLCFQFAMLATRLRFTSGVEYWCYLNGCICFILICVLPSLWVTRRPSTDLGVLLFSVNFKVVTWHVRAIPCQPFLVVGATITPKHVMPSLIKPL